MLKLHRYLPATRNQQSGFSDAREVKKSYAVTCQQQETSNQKQKKLAFKICHLDLNT
ncbi:MAG: hypothetical protein K9N40_00505 [Candidatus Cloacimonetes bacterium]|nr:hypothetical protein [Candidatus Cloacimonadota bacterium]